MPQQQPFTPAGVQQKVSDLYALTQSQRLAEASLIRSDFETWINNNFTLNQAQQTYLSQIDSRFITESADATALAVENELPISLSNTGLGPTKLVHRKGTIDLTWSIQNGFIATGTVEFVIEYQ